MKPKKKSFMDRYKTYDTSQGFGNPDEWESAFRTRMGLDEAKEVLKGKNPYVILGISTNASWEEVRLAYRKMAMKYHPDRNIGDETAVENFKIAAAAYEIIKDRFGK